MGVLPRGAAPPRFLPDPSPIFQPGRIRIGHYLNLFLWIQFSSKSTFADFRPSGLGSVF
jgi:hypothetical protein